MEQLPAVASPDATIEHPSSPPAIGHQESSESPIDETDVQELLRQYPFAAEASYFTRPNRYKGPASTWRSWTAEDRAAADLVDQGRATDLSVHLFNAFALKRKAEASLSNNQSNEPRGLKSTRKVVETHDNAQNGRQDVFAPPELWTAWPLSGKDVPRPHENVACLFPHDKTLKIAGVSSSAQLEDALIAATLKHARERWGVRGPEPSESRPSHREWDWNHERDITMQQLAESDSMKSDRVKGQEEHDMLEGAATTDFDDTEAASESDVEVPEGVQTFSSQAFLAEDVSSSDSESLKSDSEETNTRPLFSADDVDARRLLMPSTRHTLTKLDDLLTGLHKARRAYAVRDPDTVLYARSRSRSRLNLHERQSSADINEDASFIRSGSLRSIEKHRQREKRGRKRSKSASSASGNTDRQTPPHDEGLISDNAMITLPSSHGSRNRDSSARQHGTVAKSYGLRDWSDIIGMATLTGWNTETVARAAKRCADLFNENMVFRTFHEADPTILPVQKAEPYYDEEFAHVSDEHDTAPSERSATTVKLEIPENKSRTCPYSDCPRYNVPFAKKYRLERHLRDMHDNGSRLPTSDATQSPSTPLSPGVVPNSKTNSLTCPVLSCSQHSYPYTRPTRLYTHIRKEHPEIDLQSYKRIVGRNSRRGKYDRSQGRLARREEVKAFDDLDSEQVSSDDNTDREDGQTEDDTTARQTGGDEGDDLP